MARNNAYSLCASGHPSFVCGSLHSGEGAQRQPKFPSPFTAVQLSGDTGLYHNGSHIFPL